MSSRAPRTVCHPVRNHRAQHSPPAGRQPVQGWFRSGPDIEAITVNRWAHAYLNEANPLYDEIYEDDEDERYLFVRGRKPFGRIAIANSDAGSTSLLDVAIDQAHRAVHELGRES